MICFSLYLFFYQVDIMDTSYSIFYYHKLTNYFFL